MWRAGWHASIVAAFALASACSSGDKPAARGDVVHDAPTDAPIIVDAGKPAAADALAAVDVADCIDPSACLDSQRHWCDPCSTDGDCGGVGISGAACVATAGEGRFCGIACAAPADCPAGAECVDTVGAAGHATRQCKPAKGAVCACSAAAKAAQLPTFCSRSSAAGICVGVRRCLPAGAPGAPPGGGLSACDAGEPMPEVCDGKDNNCDGATDDGPLCDDGVSCTTDSCTDGACAFSDIGCSDGDLCTDDSCSASGCTHVPAACSDGNDCTADACALPGGCTWSAIDGGPCDAGVACTAAACKAGVCTASPLGCEDGDPCTTDTCGDAGCEHAALDCDDGNACTDDGCSPAGGCFSAPDDANGCSDGDPCSTDLCDAGICASGSTTCDDGSQCTVDACQPGIGCVHTENCNDGNDCTVDSCVGASGCAHVATSGCALPLPYDQPFHCADASLTAWTLQAAAAGGPGWGIDATPGKPGFASAGCSLNFNDGEDYACPDGALAVQGTATGPLLDASSLAPGTALSARFSLSGGFEPAPFEQLRVEASTGVAWVPVLTLAAPATMAWSQHKADLSAFSGTKFRIRFAFSTADCLVNGKAGPFVDDLRVSLDACGVNADCHDGDPCTADLCSLANKTCYTEPVSGPCDDGNACTVNDKCNTKAVCEGTSMPCDDGNVCTIDACGTLGQQCAFTDVAPGTPCDDDIGCTINDVCLGGQCAAMALCDDGNSCSFDSCVAGGVCVHVKTDDGYPCNDGNPCTAADACAAQACAGSSAPCNTAWKDAFACGSGSWQMDPPAQPGKPGWAIDATPAAPGFLSAGCSLNFNNGVNFSCSAGQAQSAGAATSQPIDLTNVSQASLHLFSYLDEPAAQGSVAWVEVSTDDFASVGLRRWIDSAPLAQKQWLPIQLDLSPLCGSPIRIRLRFASYGCKGGVGAGWFVDDLTVTTSAATACTVDAGCDDTNPCTTDVCASGQCEHIGSDQPCDDGNVCTSADQCVGAACVGSANSCDDGLPCTTDGCQPGAGCTHVAVPAASPCPDDDPCTVAESCFAGVCRVTKKCDDGKACTVDACSAKGTCSHSIAAEGAPCSDDDACTGSDACVGGACKGIGVACSTAAQFHFPCGTSSGWTWTNNSGAQWNIDGSPELPGFHSAACSLNFNNENDIQCLPGQTAVQGEATSPVIDLAGAGAAELQFWSFANPANDNGADLRSVRISTDGFASMPIDVTLDNDPDTSNVWQLVKIDAGKLAGKPVQVRLRFDSGGCANASGPGWFVDDLRLVVDLATPCANDVACQDDDACSADACKAGKCEHKPETGVPCDDGTVCTTGDTCLGGLCLQHSPLDCDDGNPCSDDSCAPSSGCIHTPGLEKICSDGSTCTVADTCHGAACIGIPFADDTPCDAASVCSTKGSCMSGKCLGGVAAASGTPCDDGEWCTVGETCLGGACTGGKSACEDGNPCTFDSCSGGLAGGSYCAHQPVGEGAVCDDGDACTAWDACQGSTCTGHTSICKVSFQEGFDCGGAFAWTLDAPVAGAGWAIDNQPDPPGAKSPYCSLRFGHAGGYVAVGPTSGSAVAPVVNIPAKGMTQLAFWSYGGVTQDNEVDARFVEVSDDGFGASIQSSKLDNTKGVGQWTRVTVSLSNWAGKAVQVRLRLESVVQPKGGLPGWFVDDVVVETLIPSVCATASECLPGENPCTVPNCVAGKCALVPSAALPCDDGNACTGPDKCGAGACAGSDLCDDGYACTYDFCNPAQGCSHAPVADCGIVTLPYAVTWTCGSAGVDLWQVLGTPGAAQWALDASPTLPGTSGQVCALNFNNGKNFDCTFGQSAVEGAIVSPLFSSNGVTAGTPLVARFALSGVWDAGPADNLDLDVSTDDGGTWTTLATYDGSATWHAVTVGLAAYAGADFRLRLRFWTQDCISNSGVGPFVDSFRVFALTCQSAADCSDANVCTDDLCDAASGTCSYAANSAACVDGNGCTDKDMCAAGACAGTPKTCSDGSACTDDACEPATGSCLHTAKADGAACSDGEPCTISDACKIGICKGISKADGSVCSDGNGCTTGDACATGVCTGKGMSADGSLCTDNDPCTAADACNSGACVGKPACDDGNPCTVDVCEKIDALTKKCAIGAFTCP